MSGNKSNFIETGVTFDAAGAAQGMRFFEKDVSAVFDGLNAKQINLASDPSASLTKIIGAMDKVRSVHAKVSQGILNDDALLQRSAQTSGKGADGTAGSVRKAGQAGIGRAIAGQQEAAKAAVVATEKAREVAGRAEAARLASLQRGHKRLQASVKLSNDEAVSGAIKLRKAQAIAAQKERFKILVDGEKRLGTTRQQENIKAIGEDRSRTASRKALAAAISAGNAAQVKALRKAAQSSGFGKLVSAEKGLATARRSAATEAIKANATVLADRAAFLQKIKANNEAQVASITKLRKARETAAANTAAKGGFAKLAATEERLTIARFKAIGATKKEAATISEVTVKAGLLARAFAKLSGSSKGAAAAGKKQEHQLSSTRNTLIKLTTDSSRFFAIFQGPLGPIAGRLTALATALRTMGPAAIGVGLAVGIVRKAMTTAIPAAIELQRTVSILAAATTDAQASLNLIISESQRTGIAFNDLSASYAQLAAAARGTSLQGTQVENVFRSINTAGVALRLTSVQVAGAMKALEQMISKGTVSSEEMRQQLGERLPGAFRLAADSMGLTTAAFSKQLALGKIAATDLLPKLAAAIQEAYGPSAIAAQKNLGTSMDQLKTQVSLFFAAFAKSGVLNIFTRFVKLATRALIAITPSMDNAVASMGNVQAATEKAIAPMKELDATVKEATSHTWLLVPAIAALAVVIGVKMTRAVRTLTIAMKRNPILFGVSVAITAVTALLAAFAASAGEVTTTNAALDAASERRRKATEKERAALKALTDQQDIIQAKFLKGGLNKREIAVLNTQAAALKSQIKAAGAALIDANNAYDVALQRKALIIKASNNKMDTILAAGNKLVQRKTTTAASRLLISIDKELAAKRAAAKKGVEIRKGAGVKEAADTRQAFAKLSADQIHDLEVLQKSVGAIRQKELAAATKAANAKIKQATRATATEKADNIAAAGRAALLVKQKAALGLEAGSRAALLAKQEIARDKLATATKVALAKAAANGTEKAAQAAADFNKARLDQSQQDAIDAFDKSKALAAEKIVFAHKTAVLQLEATKRAAAASARDTGRVKAGRLFGPGALALVEEQRKAALTAADKAFKIAEVAAENQKQLDITNKVNAMDREIAFRDAMAQAKAQQLADNNAAELDAVRAHGDALLNLERERAQTGADLRAAVQSAVTGDAQINFDTMFAAEQTFVASKKEITSLGVRERKQLAKKDFKEARATALAKSQAELSIVSTGLSAVAGLMKSHNRRAFELGKAAAVANVIVNTIAAAQAAMAPPPLGLGPIFGGAVAALVTVAGALNVAKIMSTKMGGGASVSAARPSASAATGSGASAGTPGTQVPAFNPSTPQQPTTPIIQITQHITAPNAQAGAALAIQQGAQRGAQLALQAVQADFAGNGPLRQQLATG